MGLQYEPLSLVGGGKLYMFDIPKVSEHTVLHYQFVFENFYVSVGFKPQAQRKSL